MTTRNPWKFVVLRITPTGWEVLGRVEDGSRDRTELAGHALGRERLGDGLIKYVLMNAHAFDAIVGEGGE